MINKKEKPLAIKIICTLGFIAVLLVLFSIYTMPNYLIDSWYPPYLILSALIIMACMVAFWHMKRWAIYLYAAFVVLNQMLLFHMEVSSIYYMILPVIIIIIGTMHLKNSIQ
ncbi:hypothetical protein JQC67_05505 [Aurantibacter crassamenti]|uniref:hypothetical protein n=1 Tax=Aurantibacter crassamenti TaxID=1837375 RepID=UPI0019396976|nr:hypothetical protein [Aurantibacter crassamenti]MBM1105593.1 hypothetical protein [Aurantibacter crassamenti]